MGSENSSSAIRKTHQYEEQGAQKISVNGSDSFVVDIERFATADKDKNASSRITRAVNEVSQFRRYVKLQRSLSRKGSQLQRGAEKKQNFVTNGERDHTSLAISPRGSLLHDGGTPEKPTMVVVVGATDHHPHSPQVHNPITIVTGAAIGAKSKGGATTITRGFSFKRSSAPAWSIDPRKILLILATISSIGTIILICCTLSINKLNGDENGLD